MTLNGKAVPFRASGYVPVPVTVEVVADADANIRIPAHARDRLAQVAAAEGMSLRAYLTRLADRLQTPAERAAQAETARQVLVDWNGYHPTPEEEAALDAELDRRIAAAREL
jgi:hypothetical protein